MRKIADIEKDLEENFEELVDYLMYNAPKKHTMAEALKRALGTLDEKINEMKRNYLYTKYVLGVNI